MKHALLVLALLLSVLTLTHCGQRRQRPSQNPVTTVQPGDEDPIDWNKVKVQLVLFGAPPCSACKTAFPIIRDKLSALPAETRAQIAVKLWVETGAGWFDAPSLDIARKYRQQEGLRVPLAIDGYSKKTGKPNYENMLGLAGDAFTDIDVGLPVAVILRKDGSFFDPANKLPDIYPPGETTFIPSNIMARTVSYLTSEKQ